ncbi:MAG: hypothetical protein LBW85_09725 [Deltaproteobacteria bacterium]|jgi:DNA polymerase-3 subunit beta|nr:hypothetical protein [Deltaproteobacteria bacterium]
MLELTADAKILAAALKPAADVAGDFRSMPVLSHVLLTAGGGKAEAAATDLETEYRAEFPADVAGEGSICVPAKTLLAAVSRLEGQVTLAESEKLSLAVRAERYEAEIFGLGPDDFPRSPRTGKGRPLRIDSGRLSRAVDRVKWCTGQAGERFNLKGVLLDLRGDGLYLASSDSDCLSAINAGQPIGAAPADFRDESGRQALVTAKGLAQVKALARGAGAVCLTLSGSFLVADAGRETVKLKLLEGEFPDWPDLVPEGEPDSVAEIGREELLKGLELMRPVLAPKWDVVFLEGGPESGTIAAELENPEAGMAKAEMAGSTTGQGFRVGFDSRRLAQIVRGMTERSEVRIEIRSDKAAVLREKDGDGSVVLMGTVTKNE